MRSIEWHSRLDGVPTGYMRVENHDEDGVPVVQFVVHDRDLSTHTPAKFCLTVVDAQQLHRWLSLYLLEKDA